MKSSLTSKSAKAIAASLVLGAFVTAADADADGGVVRIRAGNGRVLTTLFTPAEISQDLAAEFAVLVQDESTGDAELDAEVELRFVPPPGARMPAIDPWCRPPRSTLLVGPDGSLRALPPVRLTRAQSDNKLLFGTSLVFPVSGEWQGTVSVGHGGDALTRNFPVSVGVPTNRLVAVWPWLALPPFLIGMFVLNQRLRIRR